MTGRLDGLSILIVEDEYLIAMDVETICLDQGAASVTIAGRSAELEKEGLLTDIDAAIIDVMLAGAPTFGFAERLQRAGIPFIFASGHAASDHLGARFPGVALVEKPYSGADLIQALAAAKDAAKAQSAGDAIT